MRYTSPKSRFRYPNRAVPSLHACRATRHLFVACLVTLVSLPPGHAFAGAGSPPPPLDPGAVARAAAAANDKARPTAERVRAVLSLVHSGWYTDEATWNKMRGLLAGILKDGDAPLAVRLAAARVEKAIHGPDPWGGVDLEPDVYEAQKKEAEALVEACLKDLTDPAKRNDADPLVPGVEFEMLLFGCVARNAPALLKCGERGAETYAAWLPERWERGYKSTTHLLCEPGGNDPKQPPLLYTVKLRGTGPKGNACSMQWRIRRGGAIEAVSGDRSWSGRIRVQDWKAVGKWLARPRVFDFGDRAKPDIVKGCVSLLQHDDPVVRLNAAMALGELKEAQTAEPLLPLLKDPDREVRIQTAKALGAIGSREATPALIRALGPDDPELCREVIDALGKLRDERAVEALIPYLAPANKKLDRVPYHAYYALYHIGPPSVPALLRVVRGDDPLFRKSAVSLLKKLRDKSSVPAVIAFLRDKRIEVRRDAARILYAMPDARAVEPLLAAMARDDEAPALYVSCLAQVGAPASAPLRDIFLETKHEAVRRSAARGLDRLGMAAVDTFVEATESDDLDLRKKGFYGLSRIARCYKPGTEGAEKELAKLLPAFRRGLKDRDREVRRVVVCLISDLSREWSAEFKSLTPILIDELVLRKGPDFSSGAVANMGGTAVVPLVKVLREDKPDARFRARCVLHSILNYHAADCAELDEILLLELAGDPGLGMTGSERLGPAAADILRHRWCKDPGTMRRLLLRHIRSKKPLLRAGAARMLTPAGDGMNALIKALDDEDEAVRIAAAESLGRQVAGADRGRAVGPLARALNDKSPAVRLWAVRSLRNIADSRALSPLVERLGDEQDRIRAAAVEALAELGDRRAVKPIIKLLNDGSWRPRAATVRALGQLGGPDAVKALIGQLNSKNSHAQHLAAIALGRVRPRAAVEPLIAALGHTHGDARRRVTNALFRTGEAAYGLLVRALDHNDKQVAVGAARALGDRSPDRVTRRCGDNPEKWKTYWRDVGGWVEKLSSASEDVRKLAEQKLLRMTTKAFPNVAGWQAWWVQANQEVKPDK